MHSDIFLKSMGCGNGFSICDFIEEMYSAKQSLHAWTSGSTSGPFLKPLDPDQRRTRLDHWYRADTLGKSAPQFIRGLLATWPELNLCVDERPPKMTSTLRRLVCATTVYDEQSDISV